MQKFGLVMAVMVWSVMAIIFLTNVNNQKETVADAFKTTDYSYMSAKITGYGIYNVTMDAEGKNAFLKAVAAGLGLASPYNISMADENTLIYEKYSDNGSVMLELVEKDGTNHLGIKMDLKDNIESAESYEELVREIFDAEGVSGNVNLYLEGHIPGALNYEERCDVADEMLEILDAKAVTESRENDIFTIYAYTDRIDNYVKSIGKKININITASYDELNNVTVIYLATPLNNLDY